jgi:hypothetical protein
MSHLLSDDSSDLSSVPSEDDSDLQLQNKGGILKFFKKVKPEERLKAQNNSKPRKTAKKMDRDAESPPPPHREPSPPHEYQLCDNPDIAVRSKSNYPHGASRSALLSENES